MQKHVNLVDLVKSFPTNIYLQNFASIQKRTSPIKFAHLSEKSGNCSISNLSTKVAGPPAGSAWAPRPRKARASACCLRTEAALRRASGFYLPRSYKLYKGAGRTARLSRSPRTLPVAGHTLLPNGRQALPGLRRLALLYSFRKNTEGAARVADE